VRTVAPLRIGRELASLARVSRAAARAYGCRPLRAARVARRVRRAQGFTYGEALRVGVLDPAMPEAERARFVSRHANLEANAPLNNGNEEPSITEDKWSFYRHCAAAGIPVPELLGVLDLRGSSWSASGRVFLDRAGFEDMVAHDLPDEFVVKPSNGYEGRGVRSLARHGERLVDHAGRSLLPGDLWDELRADGEFGVWIVQERVHNHSDLVRLAGDASLHTVRVNTVVGPDCEPELLFAFLKLSIGGGAHDNFLGGSAGNAIGEIRLEDGRLGPLLMSRPDRIGFVQLAESPATGERAEGALLPDWPAVRRLVLEGAPRFLPTRSLGWDVALTPAGPVVIENNIRWAPLPLPSMHRVLDRVLEAGRA
jgi:hypothetical protein